MLMTIVIAGLLGGCVGLSRLTRRSRRRESEMQREASRVLIGEFAAAVDVIDLALRDQDYRWVSLLAQTRGRLDDVWADHSNTLWRTGDERWRTINDGVWAARPPYELAATVSPEQQQRALTLRRDQLVAAANVLREL